MWNCTRIFQLRWNTLIVVALVTTIPCGCVSTHRASRSVHSRQVAAESGPDAADQVLVQGDQREGLETEPTGDLVGSTVPESDPSTSDGSNLADPESDPSESTEPEIPTWDSKPEENEISTPGDLPETGLHGDVAFETPVEQDESVASEFQPLDFASDDSPDGNSVWLENDVPTSSAGIPSTEIQSEDLTGSTTSRSDSDEVHVSPTDTMLETLPVSDVETSSPAAAEKAENTESVVHDTSVVESHRIASRAADSEPRVELRTKEGTILLRLHPEAAPKHVERFVRLVQDGHWKSWRFYRVLKGNLAEFGDVGTVSADVESVDAEVALPNRRGALGAVRAPLFGNPTKSSAANRFYICLDSKPQLDAGFTVFGSVESGWETIEKLRTGPDHLNGQILPFESSDGLVEVRVVHAGE